MLSTFTLGTSLNNDRLSSAYKSDDAIWLSQQSVIFFEIIYNLSNNEYELKTWDAPFIISSLYKRHFNSIKLDAKLIFYLFTNLIQ